MELKQLVIEILNLAGITEDQDEFFQEFEEKLSAAILLDLEALLSEDEKEKYTKQFLEAADTKEKMTELMHSYFSTEDITEAYNKNIEFFFTSLVTDLFQDAPQEQLDKLNALTKEFENRK